MNCAMKVFLGVLICMLIVTVAVVVSQTVKDKGINSCDKTQCPGPIRFYEELNCKSIFKNSGDCCAIKYDCSHLRNRSANECYINGNRYKIGESLKAEDAEPCDIECRCIIGSDDIATFSCESVNCFLDVPKPGCHLIRNLDSCCSMGVVCPENPNDIAKCHVDGNIFSEGERFFPNDDPTLICQCMKGYEGQNVSPFCRNSSCGVELSNSYELNKKCAPIYHVDYLPTTSCHWDYRCQNSNDEVIRGTHIHDGGIGQCEIGDLKMNVGDILKNPIDGDSKCVTCICEIPPTPTCRRANDDEC